MPPAKVVDNGTYAALVSDVALVYKVDMPAIPPAPAYYVLTVILKGLGKPQSPQLRFGDLAARDAFYTALVDAMK